MEQINYLDKRAFEGAVHVNYLTVVDENQIYDFTGPIYATLDMDTTFEFFTHSSYDPGYTWAVPTKLWRGFND